MDALREKVARAIFTNRCPAYHYDEAEAWEQVFYLRDSDAVLRVPEIASALASQASIVKVPTMAGRVEQWKRVIGPDGRQYLEGFDNADRISSEHPTTVSKEPQA